MDEGLKGNEIIEEYIGMFQKEPSQELLAVVLTAIRRRMKQGGQLIVPVDVDERGSLKLQIMQIDGERWLPAFTSFEEELKGGNVVMSTFMADMEQLLNIALGDEVKGLIINPWNRTVRLDKSVIEIIKGKAG